MKNKGITQSIFGNGNDLRKGRFFGMMKNEMHYGDESEFESFKFFKKAVEEYVARSNETRII